MLGRAVRGVVPQFTPRVGERHARRQSTQANVPKQRGFVHYHKRYQRPLRIKCVLAVAACQALVGQEPTLWVGGRKEDVRGGVWCAGRGRGEREADA